MRGSVTSGLRNTTRGCPATGCSVSGSGATGIRANVPEGALTALLSSPRARAAAVSGQRARTDEVVLDAAPPRGDAEGTPAPPDRGPAARQVGGAEGRLVRHRAGGLLRRHRP